MDERVAALTYVLGLLSSRLLDFVFRRIARPHANGYFAANRQFLAPLPVRIADQDAVTKLARLAEKLSTEHTAVLSERESFRGWLAGELGAQRTLPGLFHRYERHDLDALLEIDRLEHEADLTVYEIYELSTGERALVDSESKGATAGAG